MTRPALRPLTLPIPHKKTLKGDRYGSLDKDVIELLIQLLHEERALSRHTKKLYNRALDDLYASREELAELKSVFHVHNGGVNNGGEDTRTVVTSSPQDDIPDSGTDMQ